MAHIQLSAVSTVHKKLEQVVTLSFKKTPRTEGAQNPRIVGESKLQSRFSPDFFDFQNFVWKGRSIATRTQCDLVEQVLCKTGLHNKDKFLEVVHFIATYQRTAGHLPKHRG